MQNFIPLYSIFLFIVSGRELIAGIEFLVASAPNISPVLFKKETGGNERDEFITQPKENNPSIVIT